MKNIFSILVLIVMSSALSAQNVGVGTSSPAEKLDVNGNINFAGKLKVNGVAGQSGQLLMTNASGATVWSSLNEYKNYEVFGESTAWNVPAGVTKIMIEVWGAGGGGAAGGGGGSGMYTTATIAVTPGEAVTILVGVGGQGALLAGSTGITGDGSSVTIPPDSYGALGGEGASAIRPGVGGGGTSYGFSTNLLYVKGNSGEPSIESYQQVSASDFAKVTKFGNGGHAAMLNYGGGKGGYLSINTTTGQNIKLIQSLYGSGFGAGGGGGASMNNNPLGGSNGANGLVIIWY